MSGLFGSTTIKGTRITDFSGTSAEVGRAIPFGYGAYPVDGFIGWAPLPPVEHRQVKRQGKGGVKQETFTYTLSYAVFFAKGQIYGFKWIKRNGKIVYTTDPNASIDDLAYAAKWASRVNFHYGAAGQLPDSLIESYEGVGNVSAFPNSCYITVEDEDVTDNGGAPPNYEACVIASPPEAYLTSHPYPIDTLDRVEYGVLAVGGVMRTVMHETTLPGEEIVYGINAVNGVLRTNLSTANVEPNRNLYSITPVAGEMRSAIKSTGVESSEVTYGLAGISGLMREALIEADVQLSQVTYGLTPTGGVLS